jgi:hypothetical protein
VEPADARRHPPAAGPSAAAAAARAEAPRAEHVKPRRAKEPPHGVDPPSIDARDLILQLRARGETEGIAVFPLPGTDPPKPGVIVPEDFLLPEGYVRHYQTTDDGEQLPPILMFHPDYEFVDAAGAPVPVPADRVVPPEMVPPGMPVRTLEVPERKGGTATPP